MRVTDLYKNRQPIVSMEFFPFRDDKTREGFHTTLDELSPMNPDYYSVTFGAGGSTRDGSYQTVKTVLKEKNLPGVAYIAGYGLGPDEITDVLDKYKALGVETIFVIRGDKPKDKDFTPHPDSFPHASDLLAFIKSRYDFTLGCAGYPEGHVEAVSLEKDIEFLKLKQDSGAEYVVVQYFYDNDFFFSYVDQCRKAGVTIPIIPGIMPVYTVKLTRILSKVCGSSIVPPLQEKLDGVDPDDADAVLDLGIDFAAEQCRGLLDRGAGGLHFYTMNRSRSTREILTRLKQEGLL
ncbi:methylenetetrahydrofolate reductase [Desulfospira joergensenii]|uniref:methylenetetrahydrofolate reductase n=1 Tax=Desulfospira joergensenii TaxID=53329 RepID=UPI0003B5D5C4|nr:methylenetetrahydrofolate reductase [Desulfospira joergensenii]